MKIVSKLTLQRDGWTKNVITPEKFCEEKPTTHSFPEIINGAGGIKQINLYMSSVIFILMDDQRASLS